MSQFEMENRDVIRMVNENHRRSNLTYTVGYVLPVEQAERYARFEHRETVQMYQAYKAMHGNSFIDEIHEEVTSWKIVT